MLTLDEILEELRVAPEGSRDIDAAIARYLGMRPCWSHGAIHRRRLHSEVTGNSIRAWTSTVERARFLIPEGYRWHVGTVLGTECKKFEAYCQPDNEPSKTWWYGYTPALALCSAALSTMKCSV